MADIGVPELLIIVAVVMVLFGAKRLPDAARSFGRSLRIFKSEVKGLHDDDHPADTASAAPAQASPPAPVVTAPAAASPAAAPVIVAPAPAAPVATTVAAPSAAAVSPNGNASSPSA
ncbi:Sec-independent protein translocase subunit TatA [Candidatus Frankia nodulisporulans]|uniref:Sec-independent protein translocase subunit TatA n=1 Tax=Candidatus Frankia nodulisporulans TaxID=2060052 RepID=UPI0013D89E4D|nr:Sec-independent protein translocase subunit TatA [Candidatus Frankia nodulisporulans]